MDSLLFFSFFVLILESIGVTLLLQPRHAEAHQKPLDMPWTMGTAYGFLFDLGDMKAPYAC